MKQGPLQIRAWMDRMGLTYRKAAPMLEIHWTELNKIVLGHRTPTLRTAFALRDTVGVPLEVWTPTPVATQQSSKRRTTKSGRVGRGETEALTR